MRSVRTRDSGEGQISTPADVYGHGVDPLPGPTPIALALAPKAEPTPGLLDEVEALFSPFDDDAQIAAALAAASSRARDFHMAAGGGAEAERSAALVFVAEALTSLMLEGDPSRETIAEVVANVSRALAAPVPSISLEVFVRASANPRLLELPPLLTIDLQLKLLLALSPISAVCLWSEDTNKRLRCTARAGDAPRTGRVRTLVRSILDGEEGTGSVGRSWIHGVPVLRWQQPRAALVGRAHPNERLRARAFLQATARSLGPVLERETLLDRSAARERTLAEANERALMRLGFDLHDGPLQDVAALSMDVQLARAEIAKRPQTRSRRLMSGRLEDLHAQITALEGSLREMAQSLEPTSLLQRPLADALRREVERFDARAPMHVTLELSGDLDDLTDTQRITIYRVVQEGLSNVRDHSDATAVRVVVDAGERQIRVLIHDNGKGFDVERTLVHAAQKGRLGLVGIGERIRLLDGQFDLRSRPGGPTSLSVSLLRWRPQTDA